MNNTFFVVLFISFFIFSCEKENVFEAEIFKSDFDLTSVTAETSGFKRVWGNDAVLYTLETDSVIYMYEFGFKNNNHIVCQSWCFPSKSIAMENVVEKGLLEIKATCSDSIGNIYCFDPITSLIYTGRYLQYKESGKDSTYVISLQTPIEHSNSK